MGVHSGHPADASTILLTAEVHGTKKDFHPGSVQQEEELGGQADLTSNPGPPPAWVCSLAYQAQWPHGVIAMTTWDRMCKVPGTKSAFRHQADVYTDVMSIARHRQQAAGGGTVVGPGLEEGCHSIAGEWTALCENYEQTWDAGQTQRESKFVRFVS